MSPGVSVSKFIATEPSVVYLSAYRRWTRHWRPGAPKPYSSNLPWDIVMNVCMYVPIKIHCDKPVRCIVISWWLLDALRAPRGAPGLFIEIRAMNVDQYHGQLSLSQTAFDSVHESPRNRLWNLVAPLAPPAPPGLTRAICPRDIVVNVCV